MDDRVSFTLPLINHTVVSMILIKSQASFAKETYKRDYILQKRPIISFESLVVKQIAVSRI